MHGVPEEGIDMWMRFDSTRNMRVLTAFGICLNKGIHSAVWSVGAR